MIKSKRMENENTNHSIYRLLKDYNPYAICIGIFIIFITLWVLTSSPSTTTPEERAKKLFERSAANKFRNKTIDEKKENGESNGNGINEDEKNRKDVQQHREKEKEDDEEVAVPSKTFKSLIQKVESIHSFKTDEIVHVKNTLTPYFSSSSSSSSSSIGSEGREIERAELCPSIDRDQIDKLLSRDKIEIPIPYSPSSTSNGGKFVSKGERACKEALEELFGLPFVTVRPSFLRNPDTGHNLEIDCYNDILKIGVEYNGEQHYKWPNHTGQTKEQFSQQLKRDILKEELCKKIGVKLIIVPYTIRVEKIKSFIETKLTTLGVEIPLRSSSIERTM